MGRRYYCEFCDKLFADNPTNKRNHLKGVFHQRMKKLHYDAFREPEVILQEESLKIPCRRFEAGICDFGDSCRYSHMTADRKAELENEVKAKSQAANRKREADDKEIRLEDWLAKRQKNAQGDTTVDEEEIVSPDQAHPQTVVYTIPPALLNFPNLPPSLLPPPPGNWKSYPKADWG